MEIQENENVEKEDDGDESPDEEKEEKNDPLNIEATPKK